MCILFWKKGILKISIVICDSTVKLPSVRDDNTGGHFKSFSLILSISFEAIKKSNLFLTAKRNRWQIYFSLRALKVDKMTIEESAVILFGRKLTITHFCLFNLHNSSRRFARFSRNRRLCRSCIVKIELTHVCCAVKIESCRVYSSNTW